MPKINNLLFIIIYNNHLKEINTESLFKELLRMPLFKDLAHYRNRPFAKTVIEGKISLEVMNLVCVRLLNEALCSAMRICVVS